MKILYSTTKTLGTRSFSEIKNLINKTPFKGSYEITQDSTNVMVTIQMGETTDRYNINKLIPIKLIPMFDNDTYVNSIIHIFNDVFIHWEKVYI